MTKPLVEIKSPVKASDDESDKPFLERLTPKMEYQLERKKKSSQFYGETESHQYEQDESEVYKHHQLQRHFEDKGTWWTFYKLRQIRIWALTFLTGLFCGACAVFVSFYTGLIEQNKLELFYWIVAKERNGDVPPGIGFFVLFVINVFLVWCSAMCVFYQPPSGGSGIPEVKCFLNGIHISGLLRFRTLVAKVIGIILSCSAGLALGKEGPMVHAGAVIAAGVSQGRSLLFGFDTSFTKHQDLRNDKEKRDFVACGGAAGVAAAFGAPIGGVLFAIEEGASFWSTKLTWRCFFCAMTTVSTLFALNTARNAFGKSDNNAMFNFGEFSKFHDGKSNFAVWENIMFTFIGCLGGLIGAAFISVNRMITQWRFKNINKKKKIYEALLIAVCMSLFQILVPLIWNRCTERPIDMQNWSDKEKELVDELVPLYCNPQTHYNELASLYLVDANTAVKQLFHFRESGDHHEITFSSLALFLFFVPYTIMAVVTLGSGVAAGLFVPSLLSGGAFGRLLGHLLHKLDYSRGTFADSGTYALMGSAAITAGITRMTISLTVMILEATGDMQYVLPLMLTVMAARLVGSIFIEGQYDIHIHLRHLNFLEEDEGNNHIAELHDVTVSEVMTKRPVCLRPVVRVGDVYDMLKKVRHNCFPVIDERSGDILLGTVMKKVLTTLIKHKAFGPPNSDPNSAYRISPLVNWGTLECIYPKYPQIEDLTVSDTDRESWLDLRPYIDYSAFTIHEHASIRRTYRMFRTLGLRHLCVVNKHNQLLGIVTRADLVSAHMLNDDKVEDKGPEQSSSAYLQPTIDLDANEGL